MTMQDDTGAPIGALAARQSGPGDGSGHAVARLDDLDARARAYMQEARADRTRRAYAADWRAFTGWCADHGLEPLPATPATLARYLTDQADALTVSTLGRRLVSIAQAHRAAGYPTPTEDPGVRSVWRGIRRALGTAQVGVAPALMSEVRAMVAGLPDTPAGVRDRALLLVGFAGALRRSELVALDVADVDTARAAREGLVVTVRRSKTDQEGAGQVVGIPRGRHAETCPVRALAAWLELAGIADGPIFRAVDKAHRVRPTRLSDRDVARIVKRAAERAGLDPARYAGHSLRAGLATSAAVAGAEERDIMRQTRHTSVAVARRYIRDGSLFRRNAAATVGL